MGDPFELFDLWLGCKLSEVETRKDLWNITIDVLWFSIEPTQLLIKIDEEISTEHNEANLLDSWVIRTLKLTNKFIIIKLLLFHNEEKLH